jgi:hypothetical protein
MADSNGGGKPGTEPLTNNFGAPVSNNQNSLTGGEHGPVRTSTHTRRVSGLVGHSQTATTDRSIGPIDKSNRFNRLDLSTSKRYYRPA